MRVSVGRFMFVIAVTIVATAWLTRYLDRRTAHMTIRMQAADVRRDNLPPWYVVGEYAAPDKPHDLGTITLDLHDICWWAYTQRGAPDAKAEIIKTLAHEVLHAIEWELDTVLPEDAIEAMVAGSQQATVSNVR